MPIPPAIQALTGITDAMVRGAPRFGAIAATSRRGSTARVFVAHNARFDYGFLKHAFARASGAVHARACCARCGCRGGSSPTPHRHNLDSLIARHALPVADRHRALGDARVLWEFVQALYRDLPGRRRSSRRSSAS